MDALNDATDEDIDSAIVVLLAGSTTELEAAVEVVEAVTVVLIGGRGTEMDAVLSATYSFISSNDSN